eukprot:8056459-Lingulodinium_polyedra.AAC.1
MMATSTVYAITNHHCMDPLFVDATPVSMPRRGTAWVKGYTWVLGHCTFRNWGRPKLVTYCTCLLIGLQLFGVVG